MNVPNRPYIPYTLSIKLIAAILLTPPHSSVCANPFAYLNKILSPTSAKTYRKKMKNSPYTDYGICLGCHTKIDYSIPCKAPFIYGCFHCSKEQEDTVSNWDTSLDRDAILTVYDVYTQMDILTEMEKIINLNKKHLTDLEKCG